MLINNIQFNADLADIITELQSQLAINHIPLLQKTIDTSKDIMVQCPYHGNGQEHRPSAGIRKSDGQFHCFACNEVHSLQEVISYCFGHYEDAFGSFGWKWLTKNFATISIEERNSIQLDFMRKSQNVPIKVNYVSEEELDKYRYTHPYWKKRKITDEHIIELFDLGYDRDTDCITFPIRDVYGRCLFVARRSTKTKYFNYPAGAEKPLYGLYELYQLKKFPDEVYICESMLDALTIWCYNKYAVALNGLGNELSIAQMRKFPCRKVILATDKDEAGKRARIRLRKELSNKIVTELDYRTYPDHAKDMNDMTFEEFYALGEVF